jgi:hypothetical protein
MLIDGLLIISINLVYAANETGRVEGYAGPSVVCDCLPESVLLTFDTSLSHFDMADMRNCQDEATVAMFLAVLEWCMVIYLGNVRNVVNRHVSFHRV